MKILLDTCEFLWLVSGDAKLSAAVSAAIRNPDNQVFLSAVSFWEISVKHGLGRLPLPQPPAQFIPPPREKHLIAPLALDEAAVAKLGGLPVLHRDPFDRMLVCQAQAHGLTLPPRAPLPRQSPVRFVGPGGFPARRTVAKYRDELGILPSNLRKVY